MSRLINGFKDPVKRPRFIIWTGVIVLGLILFVVVALGATSTYWFCAQICHTVQDDAISQYNRSTHAEISCMACHEPVNANPVVFILAKTKALGELWLTATNNYELPLNKAYGNDHLAMNGFTTEHCTQCHNLENRTVTPSAGILIDHKAHSDAGIRCTWCHNRIAHNGEGYTQVSIDPQTGEAPALQPDYMGMTACFRCHSLDEGAKVSGECAVCHTSDFELKPQDHFEADFMAQHGKKSLAEIDRAKAETARLADHEVSVGHPQSGPNDTYPMPALSMGEINVCSTCHTQKFCSDCHGLDMPHPVNFVDQHADLGTNNPQSCEQCHGSAQVFCDGCHHGTEIGFNYDTTRTDGFIPQHKAAVGEVGANVCFQCHQPTYCAACHVRGGNR